MAVEARAVKETSADGWEACQREGSEPEQTNERGNAPGNHADPNGTTEVREGSGTMPHLDHLHAYVGDGRHERANEQC